MIKSKGEKLFSFEHFKDIANARRNFFCINCLS